MKSAILSTVQGVNNEIYLIFNILRYGYEVYVSEEDARKREQKFKRPGKGNDELKKRLKRSLIIKGEG